MIFLFSTNVTKVIHDFTNCYRDEVAKDRKTEDGQLRHPTDSITWQTLDSKYSSFAANPRNVRIELASDDFNPFWNYEPFKQYLARSFSSL